MGQNKKSALLDSDAVRQDKSTNFFTDDIINAVESNPLIFPTHVFPDFIMDYIDQAHDRLGFQKSYSSLAILGAISTAIGGNMMLKLKANWDVSANLWGVVVGSPTQSKTHAVNYPFIWLKQKNNELYKGYKEELNQFNMLEKDDQQEQQPTLSRLMVKDITIEKLAVVLEQNPAGVVSLQDEMMGFFKKLSGYDSDALNDYLELWNRGYLMTDRMTREHVEQDKPYMTLIGNIQYDSLLQFNRKHNTQDGFTERFLYALPENDKFLPKSPLDIDYDLYTSFNELIQTIYTESRKLTEPIYFGYTEDFIQNYFEWSNYVLDHAKKETPGPKESMIGKLTDYVLRFSLIFFVMDNAMGDKSEKVELSHLEKAIQLFEYFKNSAFNVHDLIEETDPLRGYNQQQQKALKKLPEQFTTSQAMDVMIKAGYSSRSAKTTFYRFTENKRLFDSQKHGIYIRKY